MRRPLAAILVFSAAILAGIARWLLLHPHESMTQRQIARATDMDEG